MALIVTLPVAFMFLLAAPALHWAPWSRWIVLAGWLAFGVLAGQHTLKKMGGEAGPRWESNYAQSTLRDAPKKDR